MNLPNAQSTREVAEVSIVAFMTNLYSSESIFLDRRILHGAVIVVDADSNWAYVVQFCLYQVAQAACLKRQQLT